MAAATESFAVGCRLSAVRGSLHRGARPRTGGFSGWRPGGACAVVRTAEDRPRPGAYSGRSGNAARGRAGPGSGRPSHRACRAQAGRAACRVSGATRMRTGPTTVNGAGARKRRGRGTLAMPRPCALVLLVRAGPCSSVPDPARPCRTLLVRAGPGSPGPDRARPCRTGLARAGPCSSGLVLPDPPVLPDLLVLPGLPGLPVLPDPPVLPGPPLRATPARPPPSPAWRAVRPSRRGAGRSPAGPPGSRSPPPRGPGPCPPRP
ncbi:hypothetical protein D3C57_128765 [Streptomyces rapamycinicus NRRL 5491]|uniref:Uncharacterized protein n=1 Tax=Streptomyces rapamycinicus (strain ATCC 29253 / DSM 41530 / NRRL 5491 / AYB-994) TaxID=1343740 RepID=A0A3L8R1C9_STRRN|nr:hypothetical protein D3C57_128765 [Streptomyces rapamycinicus NRRL 5491]